MDTNRIKNVALGARAQLMAATEMSLDRVLAIDSRERVARPTDVSRIEGAIASRGNDGRNSVVEQVAYTWFNRLCALRYMDVRGYTPVGIVSPRAGETLPAILADARRGIYAPGLDISTETQREVSDIIGGTTAIPDPLGHAYVILLLAACSMYAHSMDYLFGAGRDLGPAIELLAPTDLLSEGSLLQRICAGLDEATCNEGVEVMGWLYQFYVSERKDEFFASKKKASAADIAPATQLFTPNWIVRYLVENSLGRLWMLNFPDSELIEHMDYYIAPEEPEEDYLKIYSPEDITFLDPACGSGHILVYAFDLLYLMYEEEGYRPVDIPELILKNNLTGIEIDDRAAEIASFCLEMKALELDTNFLFKDVDADIHVIHRFNPDAEMRGLILKLFSDSNLLGALNHLNEIGSLYTPSDSLRETIQVAQSRLANDETMDAARLRDLLEDLSRSISVLGLKFSAVAANPPYMGIGGMNAWLSDWIKQNFPDEKTDFCTCFIERSFAYTLDGGFSALVTMHSWMFLSSYQAMRRKLLNNRSIKTMAHLGAHAFEAISGEVVQTSATVFANHKQNTSGCFIRLVDFNSPDAKRGALLRSLRESDCRWRYTSNIDSFSSIPGTVIAYWLSKPAIDSFSRQKIGELFASGGRTKTHNNGLYLRKWWEIASEKFSSRWRPYCNGGGFRKWYGLKEDVVDWSDSAVENYRGHGGLPNERAVKSSGLCWGLIASNDATFRMKDAGDLFSSGSPTLYSGVTETDYQALAMLNSCIAKYLLNAINPTLNTTVGDVCSLPFSNANSACVIVQQNMDITREDWDAFETSWDFTWHPLVPSRNEWVDQHTYNMNASERQASVERIESRYQVWERDCRGRFDQLKANEEELNRIFVSIYGMEGEVPIEVPDDKVSVRLADLGRDIRSLISYGVGCMFGRYSLDKPGLILADEGSTLDDYHARVPNPTFEPDRTGIIPITEFDYPFFGDDIVALFRRWLTAAYGENTLGENIAFIEKALGKSLRAYFARDFYNDHVKTYQKRPIYWLFSSPKRGLQALVYLHRYTPQTVSTLLADYVRPLRDNLGAQARLLEVSGKAKDASLAAKYDATVAELDAWEHDVIFPLAQRHVELDLDDGVKANYGKPEFRGALRKIPGLN